MVTPKSVKAKIKKKFGSFSKFCALVEIDRYEFQKFFAAFAKKETAERLKYLKKLDSLCDLTNEKKTISSELDKKMIKKINNKIKTLGGRIKFCENNTEFNKYSVFQIMAGKRIRKSKKVLDLLMKLNLC